MKKHLLYTAFITFITFSCFAQSPNWEWARSAGGPYSETGVGITTDGSGNTYLTGYFKKPNITFGSITLNNVGGNDIFIVKYDSMGQVLWAKSIGGADWDAGTDITTDRNGNVYLTGSFASSSITFGSTMLTNPNVGYYDIFTVKYDSNGHVLWAKSAGGVSYDASNSITTDHSGNIYVSGSFYSPSFIFGSDTLNNSGNYDIFILKYDNNGNEIWAKSAGGVSYDASNSIITDLGGNVYVAGSFASPSIIFGSITLTNTSVNKTSDIFIVKYDSTGNVLWTKSAGGANNDEASSVASDKNGNIYLTGSFASSSITFGSITLINSNTIDTTSDIFIVKYDSTGNALWAKSAGGANDDGASSVATDKSGNIYLTGSFASPSIAFDSVTLSNKDMFYGSTDIFVAKYDNSSNIVWARSAGGTNGDEGISISLNKSGNIYLTGNFASSSITFGSVTLINNTTFGSSDIFIAKLSTGPTGITESYFTNKLKLYPNPFSRQTVLQVKQSLKNATLKVYNMYGQVVKQVENISGNNIILHRGNLAEGVYLLQLNEDNRTIATKKIIVAD